MSKISASPLSKKEIREYAIHLRRFLGYSDDEYIDVPKLYDRLATLFYEDGLNFDYKILPDNDNSFEKNEEAYTDMITGMIYVKSSVMEAACRKRYDRASFTLVHELGHYFLHFLQNDIKLARVSDDIDVPAYCDPEWQADTFSSEFLMPFSTCTALTSEEIRKKYHVSKKCSEVRFNKVQDE